MTDYTTLGKGRYLLSNPEGGEENAPIRFASDQHSPQLRPVVLKFPKPSHNPKSCARIAWEARAYQHLQEGEPIPGLVRCLGYEPNEGSDLGPFLALEWVDGITLLHALKQADTPTFSEDTVLHMGRALCQTVGQLHERGVIHRDLSFHNVLWNKDSRQIRLIDLGIALVPREKGGKSEAFEKGEVIGTKDFRAPEITEENPGDERSDIYSLGWLFFFLTNGLPRQGSLPVTLSEDLSKLINKCREVNPKKRFQKIKELEKELERIQENAKKETQDKASPPVRVTSWVGGLAVAVAVLLVGGVSSLLLGKQNIVVVPYALPAVETPKVMVSEPSPTSAPLPTSVPVARPEPTKPLEPIQTPAPKKPKPTRIQTPEPVSAPPVVQTDPAPEAPRRTTPSGYIPFEFWQTKPDSSK